MKIKKLIFIMILQAFLIPAISFSQVWDDNFVGIDSLYNTLGAVVQIKDFYNQDDSILYIGGVFSNVNNHEAHGIMSWNMDTVKTYQIGVDWGGVLSINLYFDTLLIGGNFQSASGEPNTARLAIWNGEAWQGTSLGQPDGWIYDFTLFHDTLFICGDYSHIGSQTFNMIAAYNGEDWINVGSFGMWASALEVFNGELYAGGYWGIRKYLGGTQWETFPVKPNDFVFELKADTINTFLYVGGQFTSVAGQPSVGSAMWDGFNWHPLGNYCGATVWQQAMEIYRGDLYTGGGLIDNDGNLDMYITKWNGESWDSIGGNFSSSIYALEIFRDTLYIGGAFRTWDSVPNGGGIRSKGMVKLYMPDNGCDYLKPRINTYADTFYLNGGEVDVNLYNNNPYVDSWEWDFDDGGVSTSSTAAVEHIYTEVGEYNVQVTVTDGECVKTANKKIYIELGNEVPQFEKIDMQIFPNPTSHDFIVKTSLPNYQKVEIKIAGLNGHLKSVIPVTGETTIIPTKGWSHGVYVCNLFVEGKLVKVEKIVFE
ncbi:MAG: PKD domain-containing protein [Bacteroidales bacterium]|nr:PKD domain-containing protein [Bacteroidales bacterium]